MSITPGRDGRVNPSPDTEHIQLELPVDIERTARKPRRLSALRRGPAPTLDLGPLLRIPRPDRQTPAIPPPAVIALRSGNPA